MMHNVDPLKLHLYMVKLGFTGVYIIFLISAKKHTSHIDGHHGKIFSIRLVFVKRLKYAKSLSLISLY